MNEISARQLDSILTYLDKSDSTWTDWSEILISLKINEEIKSSLLSILIIKGYIESIESSSSDSVLISLTDNGRSFINTSSFLSELAENTEIGKGQNVIVVKDSSHIQVNQDSIQAYNKSLAEKKHSTKQKTIRQIVIGVIIAVIGGVLVYYLTKK